MRFQPKRLPDARFSIDCFGVTTAMAVMRNMISKLKLAVNESKTRVCRLPEE